MSRSVIAVALLGCGLAIGCNADKPPAVVNPPATSAIATAPSASASTASTSTTPPVAEDAGPMISVNGEAADAIKRLSSPTQAVRDGAATELRKLVAKGPAAAGDPGEAFWKAKLAAIKPGISMQDLETATGGQGEGTDDGMGGSSTTFRLDHYWTTVVRFDPSQKLREVGPLTRGARPVWVAQPPGYAGKWVTYFVNGAVAHDIQFAKGEYERFTAYFDNGQLVYEHRYKNGKIEGPEVGFHRDGKKAYEGAHANGKQSGRWVHWYANGTMQSDQTYVNGELDGPSRNWREDGTKSSRIDYRAGKETGQAAWDEQGKLLYARGSAENAKTEK